MINIAIVGFGNIGSYFYKTLEKNKKNIFVQKILIKKDQLKFLNRNGLKIL